MHIVSVSAPYSKSVSHRALMVAALARGLSSVEHVLDSVDLQRTRTVLAAVGAGISPLPPHGWEVRGVGHPQGGDDPTPCDMHESGTSCRLLTAILAAGQGNFLICGAKRLHERPMAELCRVLKAQGAAFEWLEKDGHAPFILRANGLSGGELTLSLAESSQYLSGLLLAAPLARAATIINLAPDAIASWPYVGLTLQAMEDAGAQVTLEEKGAEGWQPLAWPEAAPAHPQAIRFVVQPGEYKPGHRVVEGDWSGASYLLAAGAMGPRPVRVEGLRPDSRQGDRAMLKLLAAMGARVNVEKNGITVHPSALHGIECDMGSCPDLVPTMAVLAASARGETLISGVAHLRIKESDRIAAPVAELTKAGVHAEEREDGLMVRGLGAAPGSLPLAGRTLALSAHGDHRIAMSLALLELLGASASFDNPSVVSKSFPHFWEVWKEIRQ